MIKKFLRREAEFLLDELNAPDARTLLWRNVFYMWLYGSTAAAMLGLVWIYYTFGLAAMGAVVFLLILLALQMERRVPIYDAWGEPFAGGRDRLPPPGNKALPGPSPRQISRSQRPALARRKK